MRKKILFSLIALLVSTAMLNAKNTRIRIDQIISSDFPDLDVYTTVTKGRYDPIPSLIKGNFVATIDGRRVNSKLNVRGFNYTEEGVAYALIVAANGLMAGEALDEEKKAAIRLKEVLRDQDTLSLYAFSEEIKPIFEFQKNDESLMEQIQKIEVISSQPRLYDVLVYTLRRLDESKLKRKVIIIMSDGRDYASKYTLEDLRKTINKKNIPIYSIGIKLMAGKSRQILHNISTQSGGAYIPCDVLSRMPNKMEKLTKLISDGYLVEFEVDNLEADDEFHQLELRIKYKGDEARVFKNFIATKVALTWTMKIIIAVIILLVIVGLVVLLIISQKRKRERMGIKKRKCPACNQRMKDDWDECMFCKYIPKKEKLWTRIKNKFKEE